MNQKIIITLLIINTIAFFLFQIITNISDFEYGHRFVFENELGITIDSLEITVGDVKSILKSNTDGSIMDNIDVPKKGYPHHVNFKIYSKNKVVKLKGEDFNCYNCDGSHEYVLKKTGAEYHFKN